VYKWITEVAAKYSVITADSRMMLLCLSVPTVSGYTAETFYRTLPSWPRSQLLAPKEIRDRFSCSPCPPYRIPLSDPQIKVIVKINDSHKQTRLTMLL
jgi:hypothetical protein